MYLDHMSLGQLDFEELLMRAANTAAEGITISVMDGKDRPLIFINEGFERLTGYTREEVLGKNCRFLQGPDTDPSPVDELRRAVRAGEETTVELLNYRKDGTPFWNRLSITPIRDERGEVTHYVGIQSDITELRETKLELEKANAGLELFHKNIQKELDQASKVQQFIIPSPLPQSEVVTFASLFMPMDKIGGDFFDIMVLDKELYGILIADVTGHGIPAALLTFMTSYAFQESALRMSSTANVVASTNEKLYSRMPRGSFVTMFYAIYDANDRSLTFSQAGHPEGFVLRPTTNEVLSLKTDGTLVGAFNNPKVQFKEDKIRLEPGDKLVLYTDAILEVLGQSNEFLTDRQFEEFLATQIHRPIDEVLENTRSFGLSFSKDNKFVDDFTMVGMEVVS